MNVCRKTTCEAQQKYTNIKSLYTIIHLPTFIHALPSFLATKQYIYVSVQLDVSFPCLISPVSCFSSFSECRKETLRLATHDTTSTTPVARTMSV